MSSELIQAVDKLLAQGTVNRHSYFQLKYFVIGKEPTHQAKLWRCIKELETRKQSLEAMEMEILNTHENIELCDIAIKKMEMSHDLNYGININPDMHEQELNTREKDIYINRKERENKLLLKSLGELKNKKRETEEEMEFFFKAFESLEKIEPLKPYDDFEEQTKYWNEKLAQLTNLKILLRLPLDTELVQTILSLGDECNIKKQMVKSLKTEQLLLEKRASEQPR